MWEDIYSLDVCSLNILAGRVWENVEHLELIAAINDSPPQTPSEMYAPCAPHMQQQSDLQQLK